KASSAAAGRRSGPPNTVFVLASKAFRGAAMNVLELKTTEAPAATVEALVFQLRSGIDALNNPSAVTRLSRLSEAQAESVAERIRNFKPNIASVWGLDEIEALLTIWGMRQ